MDEFEKFGGGQFGQVAGALLARKGTQDRRQFQNALKASIALNIFAGLKNNQKQQYLKEEEDIKEEYERLTKGNKEIWELGQTDREALRKYEKGGLERQEYLRNYAVQKYNSSDPAIASQVFVDGNGLATSKRNMGQYILPIIKQYELAEAERMENLKVNPTYTAKTFDEFNEDTLNEMQIKLEALENDPTKRSLFKKALNKIFGYGAAEIAEYDTAIKRAVAQRKERNKYIDFADDYIKAKVSGSNIDLNNSIAVNVNAIAQALDNPNYKIDLKEHNRYAGTIGNYLEKDKFASLELDTYRGNNLVNEDVADILTSSNLSLDGKLKVIDTQGNPRPNTSASAVISNDAAKLVGYFKFLQKEANEEGLLKENQIKTDQELAAEALRFLAKDGRFQDTNRLGGGLLDVFPISSITGGNTFGYIPLSEEVDYREVAEEFAESFGLDDKSSEFINLAFNRKVQLQVQSADDVFRMELMSEQKDIFDEYAKLLENPDKNRDALDALDSRRNEISEVLDVQNAQSYNRELTRMLISGDDSLPPVRVGDKIIDIGNLNEESKLIIYDYYLNQFDLERDEELESLISNDIGALRRRLQNDAFQFKQVLPSSI
tara:strand:+ start:3864 stop:5678 length:1815 start_codon:yes stop_codon:yes gene_type:complete